MILRLSTLVVLITLSSSSSSSFIATSTTTTTHWNKVDDVYENMPADRLINILIALEPLRSSSTSLKEFLSESSNSDSPMYGKILTKEEFEDMTVDFSAYEKVRSYLEKNLPSSTVKRVGRYVYVSDLEPAQIDDVFQTKMELFQHSVTKHVVYNSRKPYTVPAEILSHVRHIFGISSPLSNSLDVISSTVTTTSTPSLLADPNYLRKRYNIDSECTGENVALLTVLKLLPSNFFSPSDLDTFNEMYGLPSVKVKLETESSDSSCWSDPSNCAENNLDVQYASSTARYCSVHYAQLQESPSSIRINLDTASRVESFISSVLNILNSKSNQKRILSASYTIAGSALDPSTKSEIASLIQESTAQGTTFVVASGDDGARQAQGSCTLFDDTLLASPYAVVVGGTSWKSTQYPDPDAEEVAASCGNLESYSTITSGGSMAFYYEKPDFQGNLTEEYLAKVTDSPSTQAYNAKGRGYPDVSALGDLYPIVLQDKVIAVDGTSASTPLFAGILSLLHDVAHFNGDVLPSHINPLLYESISSFHDITEGNNNCGRMTQEGMCDCTCVSGSASGWSALNGWDPVTGLGTLNFTAFRIQRGWNATQYNGNSDSSITNYKMLVVGILSGCAIAITIGFMVWWWMRKPKKKGDEVDGSDEGGDYVPMDDEDAVVIEE